MNARVDAIAAPPAPAGRLRRALVRTRAHLAGAALLVALCGFAHAQATAADLVARDAVVLLRHDDPTVRGEAALVVARGAGPDVQQVLLAMARDPAAPARHRALIALGLCGSPGAVFALTAVLDDTTSRQSDDGIAAAFGLGLVADGSAGSTITRVLATAAQGSWKRQREPLLALLLAMARQLPRPETVALRQLFDDDSNRDPELRAALVTLLLGSDGALDDKAGRRVLSRGSGPERCAVLHGLAGDRLAGDADLRPLVERLARSDDDVDVRSAALAALTRAHQPVALDLAVRALREATPRECAQALRSLLALGGAGMLRAAAPRLIEERDPARKAALLRAYDAPPPPALTAECARLAADAGQPWPLRTAAVLLLARSDRDRAGPLLRDTFRATTDEAALPDLARALQAGADAPAPLNRLFEDAGDLPHQPARWRALLGAGHPEAQRQLLLALRVDARPATTLAALRAFRIAHVLALPRLRSEAIPALLRDLLGDGER